MAAVLEWTGDDEELVPASFPSSQRRIRGRRTPARPGELPAEIEAAIWRGTELGSPVSSVLSSGFVALDAELPGAGSPCHSLTEILQPQPTVAEWRLTARVGSHWGKVVLRGNPERDVSLGATPFEVDGLALPTAARVMSVANGGQTLLSQPAADWLRAEDGSTRRVHSHGHWRLKGLEEQIELFEVGPSDTALIPPAGSAKAYRVLWTDGLWTSALSLPHNLGPEPDVFVGRDRELRSLAWAFESGARVITLLGIGGIGKTRLARRYARSWLGTHPGGAWFCDLAQARGTDGITFAVAQALARSRQFAVNLPGGVTSRVVRCSPG